MKYIAIAVVSLPAGAVLGLTEAQVAPRKHALAPVAARKGWFEAKAEIQFKAGEVFLYDGVMPKAMASAVEDAEKPSRRMAKAPAPTPGPTPAPSSAPSSLLAA